MLRIVGLLCVSVYALTVVWPSGWVWHPDNPAYLQMILGIYATLGVFLWRAAANPAQHLSLIWFTVWSSVVHAAVMAVHAVTDPGERAHLPGGCSGPIPDCRNPRLCHREDPYDLRTVAAGGLATA